MTFSPQKSIFPDYFGNPNGTYFQFCLSKEVYVQKRVVYDIFMMLGDVGGLLDFILIVFKPVLGYLSSSCLTVSLVSKLFHTSETGHEVERRNTAPIEAF